MNIVRPLQLSFKHQVVEQNGKFHFVASVTLGLKLDTCMSVLEMEYQKDAFECMGDHIWPDSGMPKPQAEFLASGNFFSKGGEPAPAGKVKVSLGEKEKELFVFGKRHWKGGVPSDPELMSELALDYKTAYGGADYDMNPAGVGFQSEILPQIENPANLITSNKQQAEPAGFAPLDPTLPQRRRFEGTYGDDYLEKYFPGYPPDFDWRTFMVAPEDQWYKGYLKGDENFELHGMHPDKAAIKGKLPGYFSRCFIERKVAGEAALEFSELPLNLDTVWFFPEKELAHLIWRGGIDVSEDEAEEIKNVLVAFENQTDEKRSQAYYQHALKRRLDSDDTFLNHFNTEDLIPVGEICAMDLLQDMALEDFEESELSKNMNAKAEASKALMNEQMAELDKLTDQNMDQLSEEQLDQKLKVKEMLKTSDPAKPELDPDVVELNKRLEEILPGITSGEPDKIRLKNFSFDKIEKIMDEIKALTEKKKDIAKDELDKSNEMLKSMLEEKVDSVNDLTEAEKDGLGDSVDKIKKALDFDSSDIDEPMPKLPRINSDEITASMANSSSPEMHNNVTNLQNMLSAETDPTKINELEMLFEQMQVDPAEQIRESLETADKEFKKIYRGTAHFQPMGASPHTLSIEEVRSEFLQNVSDKVGVANLDWSCIDLSGEKLDGLDLSNAYLEQVDFTGCSLKNVNFNGAILARAILTDADLSGSNLENANIGDVSALRTNFTDCNIDEAKMSKGNFSGSNFTRAKLNDVETLEINFNDCFFLEAEMPEMKFIELTLRHAKFHSTNLTSSSMLKSKFVNCEFTDSEMTRCIWAESSLELIKFDGANMASNCWVATEPEECKLEEVSFEGACLDKSCLQNMIFTKANFKKAQLDNSLCNGATMKGADFSGAMLKQCQFRKTDLSGAVFANANIMEGSFAKAMLVNASLNSANLFGADFLRSTMGKTDLLNANLDITLLSDWTPS